MSVHKSIKIHKDDDGRWLEVNEADLGELGISHLISDKSKIGNGKVFLDFDTDVIVYMVAAKNHHWNLKVEYEAHEELAPLRSHKNMQPHPDYSQTNRAKFIEDHKDHERIM